MANMCWNDLEIRGSEEDVARFIEENRSADSSLTFTHAAPLPKGEWDYDEAIDFWGTQWDAEVISDWTVNGTSASIGFETPWNPPESWAERASLKYPTLTIELCYEEDGHGFRGELVIRNGQTLRDDGDINWDGSQLRCAVDCVSNRDKVVSDVARNGELVDRAHLARHTSHNAASLAYLAEHEDTNEGGTVLELVAANPHTPPAALKKLYRRSVEEWIVVGHLILMNPSTAMSLLLKEAKLNPETTREFIAQNPNLTSELMELLVTSGDMSTRYNLAYNPSVPLKFILGLVPGMDEQLRNAILANDRFGAKAKRMKLAPPVALLAISQNLSVEEAEAFRDSPHEWVMTLLAA